MLRFLVPIILVLLIIAGQVPLSAQLSPSYWFEECSGCFYRSGGFSIANDSNDSLEADSARVHLHLIENPDAFDFTAVGMILIVRDGSQDTTRFLSHAKHSDSLYEGIEVKLATGKYWIIATRSPGVSVFRSTILPYIFKSRDDVRIRIWVPISGIK